METKPSGGWEASLLGAAPASKRPDPIHGFIFQLKLLMLFLYRGVTGGYSFLLGTEIEEGRKFDDLVFEFMQDGKRYFRLLQAKHKLDKSKNAITFDCLLTDSTGDFSLAKYFFSFLESKKEKIFKEGTIKDVTICTNIDFHENMFLNSNIQLERITEADDVLDIKVGQHMRPIRYRFTEQLVPLLKPKLKSYRSKLKRLSHHYTDDDIKDFIKHLVFAVDCPSENDLGNIIKEEIGKEFDFFTTENVYSRFLLTMLDWLQGKERNRFISYDEGKRFFDEMRRGIPVLYNFKHPTASFTGRSKELALLHHLLIEEGSYVCIAGIGGVGKTELARRYIHEYGKSYDKNVLWFNAESYGTMDDAFRRLAANKLGISTKNVDGEEKAVRFIVEDVFRFFASRKSLIVFDNAQYYRREDQFDDGIQQFLPPTIPGSSRPHVIITTRNKKWPNTVRMLPLDVFDTEEAVEFVVRFLDTNNEDGEHLAKHLQNFPLALQQAAAYIKEQNTKLSNIGSGFNISDYVQHFENNVKKFLDFRFPEDSDNDYTKTVYLTWNVTLETIMKSENGVEAIRIINILSYMAPEDIPTIIFSNIIKDPGVLASALDILKQYSMVDIKKKLIDFEQYKVVLTIHRLVQEVVRHKLAEDNEEEETLKIALHLFSVRQNVNPNTLEHALSVWNFASRRNALLRICSLVATYISLELLINEKYQVVCSFGQKAIESLAALPEDDKGVQGCLMVVKQNTAVALQALGKFHQSMSHYQEVLGRCENLLGKEDAYTLMTKSRIADVLINLGKFSDGLTLSEEILRTKGMGTENNDTFTLCSKFSIAQSLQSLDKDKEASLILEDIYDQEREMKRVDSKTFLAHILHCQGKFDEAIRIYQEDLEEKDPSILRDIEFLNSKFSIAQLLFNKKNYTGAFQVFKEVIEISLAKFGKDHPSELWVRSIMAEILRKQGKFDAALKLFDETYLKQRTILGEEHPDTLETLLGKAVTLEDLGELTDSLDIYQTILKSYFRPCSLGNKHHRTLEVKRNIADVYCKQDKYDEALQLYLEVLDAQKEKEDKMPFLKTKTKLGEVYLKKKEYNKALAVFHEVLIHMKFVDGCDQSDTLTLCDFIAKTFAEQGKYDEALNQYQVTLKFLKSSSKGNHNEVLNTMCKIGKTFALKKDYDEALKIFQEVLNETTKAFGSDHADTLKVSTYIADTFYNQNKLKEALKHYNKILDVQRKSLGENHLDFIETKFSIAKIHFKKNDFDKAIQMYRDVLSKRNAILGNHHPQCLAVRIHIAGVFLFQGKFDEATNECQEVLKLCENHSEEVLKIASKAKKILAEIMTRENKHSEALKYLKEVLKYNENSIDCSPLSVAETKSEIAKSLLRLGRHQEAADFTEQFLRLYKEVLGKDHPKTVEAETVRRYLRAQLELLVAVKSKAGVGKVRDLIQGGCDVDTKDEEGRALIHHAVNVSSVDTVLLLLQLGADVAQVSDQGHSCLHTAAIRNNELIVEILLQHANRNRVKGFVNALTVKSRTSALHLAAQKGSFEVVRSLLSHGAAHDVVDASQKRPVDLAQNPDVVQLLTTVDNMFSKVSDDDMEVITLLKELGKKDLAAVVNARNIVGKTLLQVAIDRKQMDMARKLSEMVKIIN